MKIGTISKFNQKPKTALAWRTMYFGLSALFIPLFFGFFASILRRIFDPVSLNSGNSVISMGFGSVMLALLLSILTITTGISALKKGERSWVVWIGFTPAILICIFWILMIIGELMFQH